MKTYRSLYPQLTDFANLYNAFRKVRWSKRDRPEVAEFELNFYKNGSRLLNEVRRLLGAWLKAS